MLTHRRPWISSCTHHCGTLNECQRESKSVTIYKTWAVSIYPLSVGSSVVDWQLLLSCCGFFICWMNEWLTLLSLIDAFVSGLRWAIGHSLCTVPQPLWAFALANGALVLQGDEFAILIVALGDTDGERRCISDLVKRFKDVVKWIGWFGLSSTSLNLASLCTHMLIRQWQTLSELELYGKTVLVCYTRVSSTVSSVILEVCQCWCHTNGQIFKMPCGRWKSLDMCGEQVDLF